MRAKSTTALPKSVTVPRPRRKKRGEAGDLDVVELAHVSVVVGDSAAMSLPIMSSCGFFLRPGRDLVVDPLVDVGLHVVVVQIDLPWFAI